MNSLPGNPYVGEPDGDGDGVIDVVVFSADGSPMQTTELLLDHLKDATLALAFEQRTRALIELAGFYANDGHREHGLPVLKEINARLGMTEEP